MAKGEILKTSGKVILSGKNVGREHFNRIADQVIGEKRKGDRKTTLGPKSRLEQLIRQGFPDEEAKKRIKTEYSSLDNGSSDALIDKWIEEVKANIKNGKVNPSLIRIANERPNEEMER